MTDQSTTSPQPIAFQTPIFAPSTAGGPPAIAGTEDTSDVYTIIIPQTSLYDTGIHALKIPILPFGQILYAQNNQPTDVRIVGPRVGDPGAIVPSGKTAFLVTDTRGGIVGILQSIAIIFGYFWKQPAWYIDPQNSSGNANDNNTGLTPNDPLVHYSEVIRRWATAAPNLPQPTTITFLSDQTTFDDPVYFEGTTSKNGSLTLQSQIVQVDAGTFTGVVPENPATDQSWEVTDSSRSAANFWTQYIGYFVHDTTKNSWFWIDIDNGAKTATITEPAAQGGLFNSAPQIVATGLAAPQAGDAYIVYRPTRVYLTVWDPLQDNGFAAEISHIWITAPNGLGGFNPAVFNTFVQLTECRIDGLFTQSSTPVVTATNCWLGGGATPTSLSMNCGSCGFYAMQGPAATVTLDGGARINLPLGINGHLEVGFVFMNGAIDVPNPNATGSDATLSVTTAGPYGIAKIWGPGGTNLHTVAELDYSSPAVNALLKLPIVEKTSNASSYNTATGVWTPGIAITPANLDLAVGAGGFGGVAYCDGGSMIRAIF